MNTFFFHGFPLFRSVLIGRKRLGGKGCNYLQESSNNLWVSHLNSCKKACVSHILYQTLLFKVINIQCIYIYIYIYSIYTPLQNIGTVRPIPLFIYMKTFGFDIKKMNKRQEISISAFISRYSYLDLINNLEDSTFCLNPPIFHVSKSIGTDRINID